MSVTLDNVGTAVANSSVGTSFTMTMTVNNGSNGALVAQLAFANLSVSGVTVVWDAAGANQAFTLISSANTTGGSGRSELWGLVNPTPGVNKLITVSWTTTSRVAIGAVSWWGVDQTGGSTSFPAATPAKGTSSTPSITINSAAGNVTMDSSADSSGTSYSSPSQTQTMNLGLGPGGACGASYGAGSATVVHSWTAGNSTWASVGVNIVAAIPAVAPVVAELNSGGIVGRSWSRS